MGCLIQIIIIAVCAAVGTVIFPGVGTAVGVIVGLWFIAKLNSH